MEILATKFLRSSLYGDKSSNDGFGMEILATKFLRSSLYGDKSSNDGLVWKY